MSRIDLRQAIRPRFFLRIRPGDGSDLSPQRQQESDFAPQTSLDRDRRRTLGPVGAGGTGLVSTGPAECRSANRRWRPPGVGSLAPMSSGRAGGQSRPAGRIPRVWRRSTSPAGWEAGPVFPRRDGAVCRVSLPGFGLIVLPRGVGYATDPFGFAVTGHGRRHGLRSIRSAVGCRVTSFTVARRPVSRASARTSSLPAATGSTRRYGCQRRGSVGSGLRSLDYPSIQSADAQRKGTPAARAASRSSTRSPTISASLGMTFRSSSA